MLLRKISVVALTLALAACATPPTFQDPRQPTPNENFSLGSSALLLRSDHMTRHLNVEKNIIYNQMFGGGGLGLGLLLGPAGVLANQAMIESNTEADARKLAGKIAVDPVRSFSEAARSQGITLVESGAQAQVTPYLQVTKVTETSLNIAVALIHEPVAGSPSKYMLQLPGTYGVEELASMSPAQAEQLNASIDGGFQQLTMFFAKEGPETAGGQRIKYKSAFMTPRMEFTLEGAVAAKDENVTWIRTYGGVFGLQNGSFSTTY